MGAADIRTIAAMARDAEWIDADACAFLIGMRNRKGDLNRRGFLERIATRSSFPKCVDIPGVGMRWRRTDVQIWRNKPKKPDLPTVCNHPRANFPTCLYRHFNADGTLLYVGISLTAVQRLRDHREDSEWYRQIAKVELQWFDNRLDAIRAELTAIATENPRHNKAGRYG